MPERGWVPAPRYALRRERVLFHSRRAYAAAPSAASDTERPRALEIGPGSGAFLLDLADLGFDCAAAESSPEAYAFTRATVGVGPDIELQPEIQPHWRDGFDLLVACEVLEHIEDDAGTLRAWRDLLRQGGWALISVPAHAAKWDATDVWAGHVRRYDRGPLRDRLEESGLEVEAIESYGFPLANLVAPLRRLMHRRGEVGGPPLATARSGVTRTWETRLFPLQASWPGRWLFQFAAQLQGRFLQRDFGNGLLAVARRR
jgi:SAM-dependent methyltransferase